MSSNATAPQKGDLTGEITVEQKESLSEPSTPERAKELLAFYVAKYSGNYYELYRVIECESNFRHTELYGDGGRSFGIAQFHKPTFDKYCEGDYKDMEDQIKCFVMMFSQGLKYHWSCYKLLK